MSEHITVYNLYSVTQPCIEKPASSLISVRENWSLKLIMGSYTSSVLGCKETYALISWVSKIHTFQDVKSVYKCVLEEL